MNQSAPLHPQCTIHVLVTHDFAAFERVICCVRRRGEGVCGVHFGQTTEPGLHSISLEMNGEASLVDRLCRHLRNLVDVVQVTVLANPTLETFQFEVCALRSPGGELSEKGAQSMESFALA